MKNYHSYRIVTILSVFFVLIASTALGQDIKTFFKILPMPEELGLTDKVKELLLKKGKLVREDVEALHNEHYAGDEIMLEVDVKNGFLSVRRETEWIDVCYWKCEEAIGDSIKKYYLVGICYTDDDTNGYFNKSFNFYIVYPDSQFFSTQINTEVTIFDFFKDNATKKDIEDSGTYLTYELPKKGKNIIVHCYGSEGDGASDRYRKAKPKIKGDTIILTFADYGNGYFSKGEPYFQKRSE